MGRKRQTLGSRAFSGKKYRFSRDFETKIEAQSFASGLRKQGKQARVSPARDLQGRRYYIVWVRL